MKLQKSRGSDVEHLITVYGIRNVSVSSSTIMALVRNNEGTHRRHSFPEFTVGATVKGDQLSK